MTRDTAPQIPLSTPSTDTVFLLDGFMLTHRPSGKALRLSPQQQVILLTLHESHPNFLTYRDLVDPLQKRGSIVTDNALRVLITRLRKLVSEHFSIGMQDLIRSNYGKGYALASPLEVTGIIHARKDVIEALKSLLRTHPDQEKSIAVYRDIFGETL